MKNSYALILTLLLFGLAYHAQEWTLKLSSNVELRKWKLTSKADKEEKSLGGAVITLFKGTSAIGETTSDNKGDFVIDVPAKGDFILTISFAGCNTKKFFVTTNGVPDEVGKDKYKPTVLIGGFVLSKPITGVDYITLNEPLVKVEYKSGGQNFDKDEVVTNKGMNIISKINSVETSIIDKFCGFNKMGDEALNKKKCELAKDYYGKARALIPDEQYPIEQLLKVEDCLKSKRAVEEIAADIAAEKAATAKVANDKAIKDKQVKNNAAFKKNTASVAKETKSKSEPEKTVASKETQPNGLGGNTMQPKTNGNINYGDKTKRKKPALLGTDLCKETIGKADVFFKAKRYKEAKAGYMEALKLNSKDIYSKEKITQCDQLLNLKS